MSILDFQHAWQDRDHVFYRRDGSVALKIGTGSYTGLIKLCDYFDGQAPGSEAGCIAIGRFCSIADNITINLYGAHNYRNVTTSPLMPLCGDYKKYVKPVKAENVVIGNDVWIGNDATIMSNVTIGDGAVIGANCVVAKDIPPYAIAVGNPARVIKYRFSEEQIAKLLEISWWNWSHEKIQANIDLLLADDIDRFISTHLPGDH